MEVIDKDVVICNVGFLPVVSAHARRSGPVKEIDRVPARWR